MATSILRVGRLTSLKCLQLERCGILGTPSFCTLVEEPMKPAKKSKSKVIEAPDGRASLLAYKTVVGFPVKLFASGIIQTPALSEIESLNYPVAVETLEDTVGPAVAKAKSAVVEEQVTTEESLERVASPVVDFVPPVASAEDPVTLSESVTVTTTTPVAEEANISTFALETATEAHTPVVETVASQESSATPIMDSAPVFEASPYAEPVSLEVNPRKLVTFEITGAELPVTQKAMVFETASVSNISTHIDAAPVVAEVLHEDILAVASSTVVTATASSEPVDVSSSSSSDSDSEDEKSDDEKSEVKINGQSKEADLTENKVKDHVSETGPVSVIPAEVILSDLPVVTPLVTTEAGHRVVEAQAAPEVTAVKEAPTVVPETLPKPSFEVAGNHALTGGSEELIEAVLEIATDPKVLMEEMAPGVEVTATEVIAAALHTVHAAAAADASESIPAEALGDFKSVAEAPTAEPKELMAEAASGIDVTTTESITAAVHMVHAAVEDASESTPAEALGELKSVAEAPTTDPKELMAEAAPGVDVTTTESITAAVNMVHAAAEDASKSIPAEALGEFKSVAEAPAEVILVKAFPEAASEDIPAYPAAKTIHVEAADEVTAEAIAENISESRPVESTEEQLDLAPVVAQAAGEELQTEAQVEPEPVEASEEAATTPPQAEPEPFDISTYKNYQHHSYNPYTFADLDLEMFKYRLPQPSSGRPSPRH